MAPSVGPETISVKKRRIALWAIVTSAVVMAILAATLLAIRADTGNQILREGNTDDLREAVKILMDSYSSLINLVTTAFGAVAFLITFQQTRRNALTTRAWIIFTVGVVLLSLALLVAFVGREELLMMMTHNAVDITLPILSITRWLCYLCMVVAAILVLAFAVEVAIAPAQPIRTRG